MYAYVCVCMDACMAVTCYSPHVQRLAGMTHCATRSQIRCKPTSTHTNVCTRSFAPRAKTIRPNLQMHIGTSVNTHRHSDAHVHPDIKARTHTHARICFQRCMYDLMRARAATLTLVHCRTTNSWQQHRQVLAQATRHTFADHSMPARVWGKCPNNIHL